MFAQSAAFFDQPRAAKAALAAAEGGASKSGWHPTRSVKVDKHQKAADTRVSACAASMHCCSIMAWSSRDSGHRVLLFYALSWLSCYWSLLVNTCTHSRPCHTDRRPYCSHCCDPLPFPPPSLCPALQELIRFALTDVDVSRHPQGKDGPVEELLTGPPAEGLPLWPDAQTLPAFQPVMLAYFAAMNNLADRLIRLAAQALGLNPEAFLVDDAAQALPAWQTLMLLHYPPTPTDAGAGEYACGPHKDRFTQVGVVWLLINKAAS